MNGKSPFRAVVFAGGGDRCVWQCGFWQEAAPALNISPEIAAGVSAGATMACMIFAGRIEPAMAHMKAAMAGNPRNVYLKNILNDRPVFPHSAIYRNAILAVMDDDALAGLRRGPDLRVLLARPPRWAGPRTAVFVGIACYALEKHIKAPVHPEWTVKAGFRPEVVSIRECRTSEDVADLLLASSCTPPVIPVMYRNGRPVLDGGLVDNVPVCALDGYDPPTLVLLTRRYRPEQIPRQPGRLYVQPSRPIAVGKWDYTNPQGLQDAYDLGREDGARFAAEFSAAPDRFV